MSKIQDPLNEFIPIETSSTIKVFVKSSMVKNPNLGFRSIIKQEFPKSLDELKSPEDLQITSFHILIHQLPSHYGLSQDSQCLT